MATALKFEQYQQAEELEVIGTVKEACGKGGKIKLTQSNLEDDKKRVFVIIQKKDGKSASAICSEKLSKKLRSGEVKKEHLLGFNIVTDGELYDQTDRAGRPTGKKAPIFWVVLPATNSIEINADDVEVEEYVAEPTSWLDF